MKGKVEFAKSRLWKVVCLMVFLSATKSYKNH